MILLIPAGPQDFESLKTAAARRGYAVPEGGLERPEVLDMLIPWSQRLIEAQGWGAWLAVGEGEIVASIAVMNPVQSGAVDIGYGVAPARRGRGHASRLVQALLLKLAGRGVETVRAETWAENPASARALQKAGFTQTGARHDAEDGDLHLWSRALI